MNCVKQQKYDLELDFAGERISIGGNGNPGLSLNTGQLELLFSLKLGNINKQRRQH